MQLNHLMEQAFKQVKSHAPEIFTALSVAGVGATAYLTGKAAYQAAYINSMNDDGGISSRDPKERRKEQVKNTWRLYVPAVASGAITVGCILGSAKTNSRRTAAAVTAYSLTEKAFSEYKEKVVEQFGANKEQTIRDELAQEKVANNPPKSEIVVLGDGHVMCCELYTQRYFRSARPALDKACNDINAKIIRDVYVTLDEFYDLIGLSYTSDSDRLGWDSTKLLELTFSTIFGPNSEPCLAFEYNYVKPLK